MIVADGVDVTANFNDRLLELSVVDNEGMKADTVTIEVDDRDGTLEVPRKGVKLRISMGYRETGLTFMGLFTVDDVELSGFPRTMRISGSSADLRDNLKSHRDHAYEGKKIRDIVGDIAKRHGLEANVGASIADFQHEFVAQTEESDLHFLTRLARTHDAIAKVANGKLLFVRRGEAMSASGGNSLAATVYGWQVQDYSASFQDRPGHKKSKGKHWDRKGAREEIEEAWAAGNSTK